VATLTAGSNLGTDYDILYSILPPGGSWTLSLEVCAEMRTDPVVSGDDLNPAVVSVGSGLERRDHFVWMSQSGMWVNGNDWDIIHCAHGSALTIPISVTAWPVNSSAFTDIATADDFFPQLVAEPGGVVHCIWDSNHDLLGLMGTDDDVYQSSNGSGGFEWSTMTPVNTVTGLTDNALANNIDRSATAVRAPNGVIAVGWRSDNPRGTYGTDFDLVGAVGLGRLTAVPDVVNGTANSDSNIPGTDSDSFADLAFAPDGTLHAVWSSNTTSLSGAGDVDIFHARLTPGVGWGAPTRVNDFGFSDAALDVDIDPDLVFDDQGNLHVIWASTYNLGSTAGVDYDILYSNSTDGGANWSTPALVNSTGTADAQDDIEPRLAISSAGVLHAAWSTQADIQSSGILDIDIAYSSNSGSVWSAAELVNSAYGTTDNAPADYDLTPSLALDESGVPHVVWWSGVNHASAGNDSDIFHSERTGGTWSVPVAVNTTAVADGARDESPVIAFTPDGNPHVVWSSDIDLTTAAGQTGGDFDIFLSSRIGGVWSAPTLVNSFGTIDVTVAPTDYDGFPDMVADAGGLLHIVWEGSHNYLGTANNDADIFYGVAIPPTTLTPSVLANPNGHGDLFADSQVAVAVDREGVAHFIWTSADLLDGYIGGDDDVLHGHSDVPAPVTEVFSRDLSGWTYDGAGALPGSLGPTFVGDTTITGTLPADTGGDGSGVDPTLTYPSLTGMSYVNFISPAAVIPYHPGSTYLVRATVRSTAAVALQNPNIRLRWGHTPFSSLGGGLTNAVALTNIAPSPTGVEYTMMFDTLEVDTAGSFQFGGNTYDEKDINLFIEGVDFSNAVGGVTVTVDSLEITRLSRTALMAGGTIERDVTSFSDPTQSGETGGNSFGGAVTVALADCRADITAPLANPKSGTLDPFGNDLNLSNNGAGLVPFTPSGWPGSRRFYRGRFRLEHSATLAQPVPQIRMTVATYDSATSAQIYTAEANINPLTNALNPGGSQLNPALSANEFACYLHLPSTATLSNSEVIGDQVGASVQVIDTVDNQGGTLSLTGLTLVSFDEAVLP
ncbi:exo-alpha-sialidase, partial [Candidatus Sumerlaeota bacterium]|nr:exo-alpha-sialidase [Candidatus Sumerlaeota bacterium]